jgi:hypothetical protein
MSPNTDAAMRELAALLKTLLRIVSEEKRDMENLIDNTRKWVQSVAPLLGIVSEGLKSVMNNHESESGASRFQQSSMERYYAVIMNQNRGGPQLIATTG